MTPTTRNRAPSGRADANPSGPQALWAISSMGMELAAVITAFTLIGYFADQKLGTAPVLLIVGVGVGLTGGGYNFMRNALKISRRVSGQKPTPRGEQESNEKIGRLPARPSTGRSTRDLFDSQVVPPAEDGEDARLPEGFGEIEAELERDAQHLPGMYADLPHDQPDVDDPGRGRERTQDRSDDQGKR